MQILILCGGLGTRLREETEFRPKPLVQVGPRPILWHIMKSYAQHGFKDFVLLLGYKGEMIREYFLNYHSMNCDVTVALDKPGHLAYHGNVRETDWRVTLVDTGARTMTGGRIARAARFIDGDRFCVTYGDGLANLDFGKQQRFHKEHGKLATITGVHSPPRFGGLAVQGEIVTRFAEKEHRPDEQYINGGFFVFERKFLDYLSPDEDCILEREPLEKAARDDQLRMYPHTDYWQCMDTQRDFQLLNEQWASGEAPWKTWPD